VTARTGEGRTQTTRYTLVQRLLHWLIALLVLGLLVVGMVFSFLGFEGTQEAFGREITNSLYTYHKTFSVIVLALMIYSKTEQSDIEADNLVKIIREEEDV